jgi:quercetin dioxygenase-like cupin family protein
VTEFEPVDLVAAAATGDGVAWSASPDGLNANLVVLGAGASIGEHRNDEVDVLIVGVAGEAVVTVEGVAHELRPGRAGVVPKGSIRRIDAGELGARYLSIHRARGSLGIRSVGQG